MNTFFKIVFAIITTAMIFTACKKSEPPTVNKYAWVVGNKDSTGYATILFTSDGGQNFTRQGLGQSALLNINLTDVWAVNKTTAWAVGDANSILKTTDGGNTWQKITPPVNNPNQELYSISIPNPSVIYISGNNSTVYKSVNGGDSWTACNTSVFGDILLQGIWATSATRVITVGGTIGGDIRGFIRQSADGGNTWDSIPLADDFNRHEWITPVSFGNTIIIYGSTRYYTVSRDNGLTWHNDSIPVAGAATGADINHMIMLSPQIWWAAMDFGHIVKTTDGGATWTDPSLGLGINFMTV
jgi:photosystem II stability/assembly factor-like uncharacterized protein